MLGPVVDDALGQGGADPWEGFELVQRGRIDIDDRGGSRSRRPTVAGTDRSKAFGEVALAAYVPHNYPLDKLEPGLDETAFYDPTNFTFPAGTHICEVEIDPDTGVVQVVNFSACDDFGNIVNPMIVEGQVHGGVAQGVGGALLEELVYDEGAQCLSASFMDYLLPTACDVPDMTVVHQVTNGGAVMPAFKGKLTPAQIQSVATFVSSSAGK